MKLTKLNNGISIVETSRPFEGLPNGDERLAKILLAGEINKRISQRKLKQKEAAELLHITQPEVSSIGKGRVTGFTFDRLYRCLIALDMDVEISIKKHPARAKAPAGVYVNS